MSWQAEEIATLKRLWDDGMSGDDIGKALQRTRNSVLGCIYRHGWQRGEPRERAVPLQLEEPKRRGPKPPPKPSVAERVKAPIAKKAPIIPEPPSLFKTLVALATNECRYAVNNGGPYLFCGQPVADRSRYCPHHKSITTRIVSLEAA